MKKVAVFMTVGTGMREDREKGMKDQAHGISYFINEIKPDKIVFFVSKESKETIKYVEGINEDAYEIVLLDDINNITEISTKIFNKVLEYEKMGYEIKMNYTFGTKTMTTAISFISVLKKKDLYLVGGQRGKDGTPVPGTEEVKKQSLHVIYDIFLFNKMKELFNSYNFSEALKSLNNIVVFDNLQTGYSREDYENLIKGCTEWDKFNHKEAIKYLENNSLIPKQQEHRIKRLVYLADKDAKEEIKEYHAHLLSDLINNAKRRIEEGKYDDAVARLYRVIEFIAQSKLFIKHDINTSDVDILLLPNELREKYKKMEENGKIRLGLKKSYELLRDMNEEIGKRFFENEEIQKILSMRNNSILAHGFGPIKKEQAEKFFEVTKEFLTTEIKETEQFMEELKFIKL